MRPAHSLGALIDALPPSLTPTLLTLGVPELSWRALEVREVTIDPLEVSAEVPTLMIARSMWYRDTHEELQACLERGALALLVSRPPSQELLERAQERGVPVLMSPQEDPTLGLIADAFYDAPTKALKVYGVTGTNGKTSTVSFLAELLEGAGERVAVMGTVAYRFEGKALSAPNTTPDALVIHRFARDALNLGATALALEVSSHALTLERVASVRFDAVGFTNLSRDHLDFHGDMEGYRGAKGLLFSRWMSEALEEGKRPWAVAYEGDEGEGMLSRAPSGVARLMCRALSVGERPAQAQGEREMGGLCVWHTTPPNSAEMRLEARVGCDERDLSLSPCTLPLIGDYHPANIAVALGMLYATHHVTPERVVRGWGALTRTRGVSGRMERALSEGGRVALVDYAHTPEAVTRALEALRAVHQGEVYCVLGCGGDRDRGKRPLMARAALALSDRLYLTSDNPRSEAPERIIQDALEGLSAEERARVEVIVSRREALHAAWRALPRGGALLAAGKGHEAYQEYVREGRVKRYALSDAEALRAAAVAERTSRPLAHVPLRESARGADGQALSPLGLLYEAGLREGGLTITLSYQPSEERPSHHLNAEERAAQMLTELSHELTPQRRSASVQSGDLEALNALMRLINEGLRACVEAHRGARAAALTPQLAWERGKEEGSAAHERVASVFFEGWEVGGVSAAYLPTLT